MISGKYHRTVKIRWEHKEGGVLGWNISKIWELSVYLFEKTSLDMDTAHGSHSIIQSFGLKGPLRSPSPTINPALPSPPLNHAPKCFICTSFKHLQGWWPHHFPGQPVPTLTHQHNCVKLHQKAPPRLYAAIVHLFITTQSLDEAQYPSEVYNLQKSQRAFCKLRGKWMSWQNFSSGN